MKDKGKHKSVSLILTLAMLLMFALPALAAVNVNYLDENGVTQVCALTTDLTGGAATTLNDTGATSGWYSVSGTATHTGRITVSGNVKIILIDNGQLNANQGFNVTGANSLTVYAQSNGAPMGKLTATTTVANQAGIGGNTGQAGGTITIVGGFVIAQGNGSGAGVGGGRAGAGGTIKITGNADVTATGGSSSALIGGGAGIGGGGANNSVTGGAGGTIEISGNAIVRATGGFGIFSSGSSLTTPGGAGIGGGGTDGSDFSLFSGGAGGNITIKDNVYVEATGGGTARSAGAGIGGGGLGLGHGGGAGGTNRAGDGGIINISGGTVIASSSDGAGIGGASAATANGGAGGTITITGTANVTASSTSRGAGIGGGGNHSGGAAGAAGDITISGAAVVTAAGGGIQAGIGGGNGGNIIISGVAVVTATGGDHSLSAGIGASLISVPGNITIDDGTTVKAYARYLAINAAGDTNSGTAYVTNAHFASNEGVTDMTVSIPGGGSIALTLPTGYLYFAFTSPVTAKHPITATNLTPNRSVVRYVDEYDVDCVNPSMALQRVTLQLSYAIKYDANSGTGSISDTTGTRYQAITLSNGAGFSRTGGYTLVGWNTAADGGGTPYTLSEVVTMNDLGLKITTPGPVTLYAQWMARTAVIPVPALTITTGAGGGALIALTMLLAMWGAGTLRRKTTVAGRR